MYRLHVFDSQGNNRQRRDHFPRLETYWVLSANTNMLLTNRNLMGDVDIINYTVVALSGPFSRDQISFGQPGSPNANPRSRTGRRTR